MNDERERAEFEAFCVKRWAGDRNALTIETEGRYAGEYKMGNVEGMWCAWQARAALAATPTPAQAPAQQPVESLRNSLEWALDLIDMYDERLVELGDPPNLVNSDSHMRGKALARSILASQAAPTQAPAQPRVSWPKARDLFIRDDMGQGQLRVLFDGDNDVNVCIWPDGAPSVSLEFCCPGSGGGKAPRTREALIALMVAMEQDGATEQPDDRAAAPPQAAAQAPAVTAKPIVWTQDNANQWSESDYGFYITLDSDEDRDADNPYFAAWGEGDEDRFDSLEAAQRWCQDKINSYFREYAVVHGAPAQAAQPEPAMDLAERARDFSQDYAAQAAHSAPVAPDDLRGLDTDTRVRFYEHDFYVLSNFSAFTLYWDGLRFDTSEAAYHYEKFPNWPEIRAYIKNATSAHEAFKHAEANKSARRPDWDDVKVGIMLDILRAKVQQHEYVRRKLLATGDRELVEDSWRDDFWGWGPNRDGKNMLGVLWMRVRAELRAAPDHPATQTPNAP